MSTKRSSNESIRPRIAPELASRCEATKPPWFDTTSWINHLIHLGLEGVAGHVTLEEPSDRETHTKKRGSESNRKTYKDSIKEGKEKKFKFKFKKSLVPFSLDDHADKIEEFWKAKNGAKSEASWRQLVCGLEAIQSKYGSEALQEQLDLAIVGGPKGPWSSITLKNYEQFSLVSGKFNGGSPEPMQKHPAQRVFTASGGFQE